MKRIFIFFALLVSVAFAKDSSVPIFNDPNLGKTHFIVGLPPEQVAQKENPSCIATAVPGILQCIDGSFKRALFSPEDDVQKTLIELIGQEREYILVAVFSFTDGTIAQALIDAKKRGVTVEVITDISCTRDKFSKIGFLKENGIKIFVYNPKNISILNDIMHHKFVLFGKNIENKQLLWTGSFNFTKSANINNQENILILDELSLIERYRKQFALLKEKIIQKEPQKLAGKKKRFITTIPS